MHTADETDKSVRQLCIIPIKLNVKPRTAMLFGHKDAFS